MQTKTTDYRLERWIAVLLGLLFFLPFVARADDILATGAFHGAEMKHTSGESFLAMVEHKDGTWSLDPVRIRVSRVHDPIVDEIETAKTGRNVEVEGFEGLLIRGTRLQAGRVATATPSVANLDIYDVHTFVFGKTRATVRYRCANAPDADGSVDCSLVLESNGIIQELGTIGAYQDGPKLVLPDVLPQLYFAGDLDRDGKLDLLIDMQRHYNEWHPVLFLSTAAGEGELVRKTAELVTTGC
jgi:hypothetical protein